MQTSFSRFFPATHPQRGNPTLFVEKYSVSFGIPAMGETFYEPINYHELNPKLPHGLISDFEKSILPYWNRESKIKPKKHTIRAGKKCRPGDLFYPKCWSGAPYNSKPIIFHHPFEVKRVVDLDISAEGVFSLAGKEITDTAIFNALADNDGLDPVQFLYWLVPNFSNGKKIKPFNGQIRIWNDTNLPY